MSIKRHLAVGFVLASGLVALTGSALAAPPGTPPGQAKKAEEAAVTPAPAPAAAQPGQAAPAEKIAPGQAKKAEQAPAPAATAPAAASTGGKASSPGQAKKAAASPSGSPSSANTQGVDATSTGIKPSSTTEKSTKCFTGGSVGSVSCAPGANPPDSSKRYGNGTTAAQIAVSRGAPANTEIRGPGNSQPHKVCGKNGNWVDVHAVKSYAGICTETAAVAAPTPTVVTVPTTVSCPTTTAVSTLVGHETGNGKIVWISPNQSSSHFTHGDVVHVTLTLASGATCAVTVQTPTVTGAMPVVQQVSTVIERALGTTVVSTTAAPAATTAAASPAAAVVSATPAAGGAGGVAGVQETQTAGGAGGGVLGAFGVLGQTAEGTLPFTGFPLWLALLVAIVLIAIGWTLWRRGRPVTTRDVV